MDADGAGLDLKDSTLCVKVFQEHMPATLLKICQQRKFLFTGKSKEDLDIRCEEHSEILKELLYHRPFILKSSIWSALATLFPIWGDDFPKDILKNEGYALKQLLCYVTDKSKRVTSGAKTAPWMKRLIESYVSGRSSAIPLSNLAAVSRLTKKPALAYKKGVAAESFKSTSANYHVH